MRSSAGNTRGLIEATTRKQYLVFHSTSSAGNTRGLIEAWLHGNPRSAGNACLPRGIPAALIEAEA